jgi:hypothetical protein
MTVITKNLAKLQNFYEVQAARLQANERFIALMALPPLQRWLSIAGLFLLIYSFRQDSRNRFFCQYPCWLGDRFRCVASPVF